MRCWRDARRRKRLRDKEQVFIITHSPYLIRKFDSTNHQLVVLTGQGLGRRIDTSTAFGLLELGEPAWGEINYRALDICSHEFHNELYRYVTRHVEKRKTDGKLASARELDDFLGDEGLDRTKTWLRGTDPGQQRTLAVYIRNAIHRPENQLNSAVTSAELRESTEALVGIVENLEAST